MTLMHGLILMRTKLQSCKVDRAFLKKLGEIEKKLDMYKKIKEDK